MCYIHTLMIQKPQRQPSANRAVLSDLGGGQPLTIPRSIP